MTMSPSLILRLLELAPQGMVIDALHDRLLRGKVAADRMTLLRLLEALRRDGRVSLGPDRRWRSATLAATSASASEPTSSSAAEWLGAVRASFHVAPLAAERAAPRTSAAPQIGALLSYYAATLRQDARAAVAVPPGRHGETFQLFHGAGAWRPTSDAACAIRIPIDAAPAAFRQALARRDAPAVAIGWPLAVLRNRDGGVTILPVATMTAIVRQDADAVMMTLEPGPVALNAEWLASFSRSVRRDPDWIRDHVLGGPGGERGVDALDEIGEALGALLATQAAGPLRPDALASGISLDRTAIHNCAAAFLPGESQYTQAAAADLDALARLPEATLAGTALGPLLGVGSGASPAPATVPTLNPGPLTIDQLAAAEFALRAPLTVVTGPPGTGKSQVIAATIVSLVAAGGSALFASRNHQAIDAVEERLSALTPGRTLMTRALDATGERNIDFLRAVDAILSEPPAMASPTLASRLERLRSLAHRRKAALEHQAAIESAGLRLSALADRLEAMDAAGLPAADRPGIWRRLLRWVLRRRRRSESAVLPREGASRAELESAHRVAAAELVRLRTPGPDGDPVADDAAIAEGVGTILPDLLATIAGPDGADAATLRDALNRLRIEGGGVARMDAALARAVLRHRPVWAVSTLAAPKRTPPIPGLFDVVIFDEAGQCDIASAMPLLARARRAVVVGDPAQLSVIQGLGVAADRELIRALGVGDGAHRFAQSLGSLFDLAASSPVAEKRFLSDQFRSDPDIVAYLNDAFYGRRLRARVDRATLSPPPGARPGLSWRDVRGPLITDGGRGCASPSEAEAIIDRLSALATAGYDGSAGVIAPFNQQVALIERMARERLSAANRERLKLRIATVDRFQGAERDLILFSICGGADAPPGARRFLASDRRRFNVAISRARTVCEIVGDVGWARASGIDHLERLARRAVGDGSGPAMPLESPWEERLFSAMRARGLEPRPQYEVAGARLDFALFRGEVRLDVEVDGRTWHMDGDGRRKSADHWRDHKLRALGWKVRRFWVFELRDDMEKCLDLIDADLRG